MALKLIGRMEGIFHAITYTVKGTINMCMYSWLSKHWKLARIVLFMYVTLFDAHVLGVQLTDKLDQLLAATFTGIVLEVVLTLKRCIWPSLQQNVLSFTTGVLADSREYSPMSTFTTTTEQDEQDRWGD